MRSLGETLDILPAPPKQQKSPPDHSIDAQCSTSLLDLIRVTQNAGEPPGCKTLLADFEGVTIDPVEVRLPEPLQREAGHKHREVTALYSFLVKAILAYDRKLLNGRAEKMAARLVLSELRSHAAANRELVVEDQDAA